MEIGVKLAFYALYVLFVVSLFASIAYHKSVGKILAYLQSNHKEKIGEFGLSLEPNPKGVSFGDLRRMSKFLKSPEYFNDKVVEQMKEKTILYDRSYKIILALWIISMIIFNILKK